MDETISSLLINENFGGIGSFENLAPGTSDNNKNHLHTFEKKIKELIGDTANDKDNKNQHVVGFETVLDYKGKDVNVDLLSNPNTPNIGERLPKQSMVPNEWSITAWAYKQVNGKWEKAKANDPESKSLMAKLKKHPVTFGIDQPKWETAPKPTLDFYSDETWLEKYFVDNGVKGRTRIPYNRFIFGLQEMSTKNVLEF